MNQGGFDSGQMPHSAQPRNSSAKQTKTNSKLHNLANAVAEFTLDQLKPNGRSSDRQPAAWLGQRGHQDWDRDASTSNSAGKVSSGKSQTATIEGAVSPSLTGQGNARGPLGQAPITGNLNMNIGTTAICGEFDPLDRFSLASVPNPANSTSTPTSADRADAARDDDCRHQSQWPGNDAQRGSEFSDVASLWGLWFFALWDAWPQRPLFRLRHGFSLLREPQLRQPEQRDVFRADAAVVAG